MSGSTGSAPTKKRRNGSVASAARSIVAPFPTTVTGLAIAGNAAGPYQKA
ncbi:hypothetical protein HJD18_06065 [Thermoleophilia bacterium SCSIO 60948]|nr:hypothetical protein HJD18_06065 [Thermoleophilia bacterium SCSIO 60948]